MDTLSRIFGILASRAEEVSCMPGGSMGLTIHFEREAPEALEQWLRSEARYIIGAFGKPYDLEKIFGPKTEAILAESKLLGEKVVSGITMILDGDLRKLDMTLVRLRNGDTFLIDENYRLIENAEANSRAEALVQKDSPRVFSVINK
jgi:hypothetical protein